MSILRSILRKWNKTLGIAAMVFALCVFLLLALVSFQKTHYDHPEAYETTFFYHVSKALFGSLGGSAYFLVTIALLWSVIVFFRERNRDILVRAGGLAVMTCATAALFALWGGDYLGGSLGAGIAGLLGSFPGPVVSSILVSVVFVVSFFVATDNFFYAALREALAGPDLLDDDRPSVALPAAYDEEQVISSEEEFETEAEEEEEDEEAARVEIEEEPEESPATVAAVPEGLRKALGSTSREIEVEVTGVELADDEAEAPPASAVDEPPVDTEPEESDRMPVGRKGHEIAVHRPDVEFADEGGDEGAVAEEAVAAFSPVVTPEPGLFEAEDVLVSEEAEVPGEMSEEEPAAASEAPPEPDEGLEMEPPQPELPFGDVVLEDEVIEWGAPAVDEEDGVEAEPADEPVTDEAPVVEEGEDETVVEAEPVAEASPEVPPADEETPEDGTGPSEETLEALRSAADEKFDRVLDSLLGPAAEGQAAETETAVATEEAPPEHEVEPEADLPESDAPVAEIVDESPEPETETEAEEETPTDTEEPELEPEVDAPVEEEAPPPEPEPPSRGGLVGWFRRNRPKSSDDRPTASATVPKRTRRRVSDTPDLFDPEPSAGPSEPGADLVDEAALLVIEMGRASVVLIQRRLGIGYNRARKLVERLVAEGVLGPMGETGSHPVLMTEEAWRGKRSPVS
jgi:hypothetical protein